MTSIRTDKAVTIAQEGGFDDLVAALRQALDQGWVAVDIEEVDGDVLVMPHSGAMIGYFLPEWEADTLRVNGGEDDLHVTFAFLGENADLTDAQRTAAIGVIGEVMAEREPGRAKITGTGVFENGDERAWHLTVELDDVANETRQAIVDALSAAGVPFSTKYDFTPHITLAYLDADQEPPAVDVVGRHLMLDVMTASFGSARYEARAGEEVSEDRWREWDATRDDEEWRLSAYVPVVKSAIQVERRFTLGPMYVPDFVDAHGDWANADDLQTALWRFVQNGVTSGDNGIRLQHDTSIIAGRWVEAVVWPWPITVPIIDPNGNFTEHTFPAGTPFLGTLWEPWAWEEVKAGRLTGYSIGAMVERVPDEVPGAPTGTAVQ